MKNQFNLNWLVPLIAILAAITASIGLFSTSGEVRSNLQLCITRPWKYTGKVYINSIRR